MKRACWNLSFWILLFNDLGFCFGILAKQTEDALSRAGATDGASPKGAPARAVQTAPTSRRVALIIGNGAYTTVDRLKNPANDASAVAAALTRLGFDVVEKHDLGVVQMQRVLRDFEDKAEGAEWALVYYAGHGLEQNGKNWLIPVDAELTRATDLPDEAIPVERVLDRLSGGESCGW